MYDWIHDHCMAKPGVTNEYKDAWAMSLYRVGGKIFAEIGADKSGAPLLSVKLEPAFSDLLRAKHPGQIVPGYYCNKMHWSSLYLESGLPRETAYLLLDSAYALVFASLPKKTRQAIEEEHAGV